MESHEEAHDFEHTETYAPPWRKRLIVVLMLAVTAPIVGRASYSEKKQLAREAEGRRAGARLQ